MRCNAAKGRLRITPSGAVTVTAEGAFSNAACFTSLDGVTYSTTPAAPGSFECHDAINGWTMGPYATRGLCLVDDGGVVRLMGGLPTSGTNSYITTFSTKFWPAHDLSVEVDLCNGQQGRVLMHQFGGLSVEAEHGFGQAACFTSLEGVSR